MRCPKCQSLKSSVVDSRQAEDGNTIRRRRSCDQCGQRFTTYERIEEKTLVVVKKDGTREQFSREKIFNGIIRSAQKRPVSTDDIDEVVNRIEQKVRAQGESEIESDVIGNLVMEELVELDEITYVRFASVYRSFKDVEELENLLKQMISKGSKVKTGSKDEAK
ncbi:transcriptional regulator NrdR [Streptococcus suis]|uniref:transcriptional regulator NrdR n=1 Tax=Streptococcus suis TaxID=1307 RepID=UPI000CF3BDE4|nr:transcriptional regulator NrdR [Streptococcus suis]